MAKLTIIPTPTGSVVACGYGFGVALRGTYTPNELFGIACELLRKFPMEGRELFPPAKYAEYYNYAWFPWSRCSLDACSRICDRTRMVTQLRLHSDDVHMNYVGSGRPYREVWSAYYPLQTRLAAISTGLRVQSVRGLRLLDLGCAGGRRMLEYHANDIDVFGIEANHEHVREAPELIRPRIILGDALVDTYVFSTGAFNVIVCSVLGTTVAPDVEHLFRECSRLLSQRGLLILDVPPVHVIGTELSSDNKVYTKVLRRTGFTDTVLYRHQILARKR